MFRSLVSRLLNKPSQAANDPPPTPPAESASRRRPRQRRPSSKANDAQAQEITASVKASGTNGNGIRLALRPRRLRYPASLPVAGLGAGAEAMAAATSSSRPQRHALSPRHALWGMRYADPLSAMPLQSRRKLPRLLRALQGNARARRRDPPGRTCSAPLPATSLSDR